MSCFAQHAVQVRYRDRAQWLDRRRAGIGGSDIAAVLGVSPWRTPLQVWASKLVELDEDADEVMAWGRRFEPLILDVWAAERRSRVTHRGALIRNRERPWMMATLDGVTRVTVAGLEDAYLATARRVPALVEAKSVSDWTWPEIPQHYQLQAQWSMAVAGFELAFLVVLHGGRKLDTYDLPADPAVQAELIDEAALFWQAVEAGEPPAAEAGDLAFLSSLFPQSHEQAVEIPPDAVAELYDSRRAYDAAKERKEDAEATVKAMLADADTAVSDQTVIATWKTNSRRGVDVGRLRIELPHVADRYTVKTTERRFLVKGEER